MTENNGQANSGIDKKNFLPQLITWKI